MKTEWRDFLQGSTLISDDNKILAVIRIIKVQQQQDVFMASVRVGCFVDIEINKILKRPLKNKTVKSFSDLNIAKIACEDAIKYIKQT